MDVGNIPPSLLQKLQKTDRVSVNASKGAQAYQKADPDSVSVSSQGKTRHAVRKAYDELPNVNQEKINYFRQQIADGTYKPLSKEVVVKIFDGLLGQR